MSLWKRSLNYKIKTVQDTPKRIYYTLSTYKWNSQNKIMEEKLYDVIYDKTKEEYNCDCFRFGAFMKECSHIWKIKNEKKIPTR